MNIDEFILEFSTKAKDLIFSKLYKHGFRKRYESHSLRLFHYEIAYQRDTQVVALEVPYHVLDLPALPAIYLSVERSGRLVKNRSIPLARLAEMTGGEFVAGSPCVFSVDGNPRLLIGEPLSEALACLAGSLFTSAADFIQGDLGRYYEVESQLYRRRMSDYLLKLPLLSGFRTHPVMSRASDIAGNWKGSYTYSFASDVSLGTPLHRFELVVSRPHICRFHATVVEDDYRGRPLHGRCVGWILGDYVTFDKSMHSMLFNLPTGRCTFAEYAKSKYDLDLEETVASPPVRHIGRIKSGENTITGKWLIQPTEFVYGVGGRRRAVGIPRATGSWVVSR